MLESEKNPYLWIIADSNMTLTFSHWAFRKQYRVKICDKSRY